MKNKKRLGFLSAIMGVCISATSIVGTVAFADGEGTLYGAENETNVVFFENDVDYFKDGDATIDLTSTNYSNLQLEVKLGGQVLDDGKDYFYDAGTIIYGAVGTYTVTLINNGGDTDSSNDVVASESATIEVVGKSGVEVLKYVAEDLTAFKSDLESKVSALGKDDTSIEIPSSFWKTLDLGVFESDHIRTKLYVAKPKSDFSAVNSSYKSTMSKITLSSNGTYAFYVELKDCFGNELVVDRDTMTQKVDGWYDENDNLVIPIFSFEYHKEVLPLATISAKVTSAIIGVEYTSGKAETENISRNKVTLYYNASETVTEVTLDDLNNLKNGWVVATADHATFGTLSATSLKFTPLVKGSFAYKISATGSDIENSKLEACSKPINVATAVQEQKLVNVKFRNFLKNNWLSLVFLGIAFLCIIGIIVLAFYKPKDAEEVKAKKLAKKDKVEDPDDVVEAEEVEEDELEEVAEEAEEVEEATEEDSAEEVEEATEEEPAEDAVEEVEETPAEKTPVEEVVEPPVEEVKPEGENA